jgi:hypothetical protein
MAVTNTGIVLRTITGVNESDLFLDSEATSVTTNTGIVERSILGVHDANFVRPLGDEEVSNGGFDDATDWTLGTGWSISGDKAVANTIGNANLFQASTITSGKIYKATFEVLDYQSGSVRVNLGGAGITGVGNLVSANGVYTQYITSDGVDVYMQGRSSFIGSIDNVSVKEMLVNRESTATNTGIVERNLTGVNESDLWLDSESTSVVNNTGIVERPITGVNESDPMFPDNTDSTVVNISDFIIPLLTDLEARATTFENREATQEILINLQKC